MQTTALGNLGEQLAKSELVRQGYEVIEHNWKNKFAEIDIVARKADVIFFVEVKYRGSLSQGDGFSYITSKKLQHMKRAANLWTLQHNWEGEVQLLAAAVDGKTVEIVEVF